MSVKADCKTVQIGGFLLHRDGGFLMDETPPENL